MGNFLDYMPIAAAAFAIPQFLPQLLKLRATDDTAGVSWSWATLTSVNNAAWFVYFAASAYWAALVPAFSATLLAGTLAIMLGRRGQATARPAVLIGGWVALLVAGSTVAGRTGLGALLTAAFILQVTPSLWTAYRTAHLTGLSRGTWLLILGELSCWTIFGLHQSDPRLLTLGVTGVTASTLMLARIRRTSRTQPLSSAAAEADPIWSAITTRQEGPGSEAPDPCLVLRDGPGYLRGGGAPLSDPQASRPYMPGYGILGPDEGRGLLPWSWAEERLIGSHDYWVATVWPDGRPHVMPVWGIWHDESVWFSSSLRSRKARNLRADPRCVVTTDNPTEPVVVEGVAEVVREPGAIQELVSRVNDKYASDITLEFMNPDVNATFRVLPRWVFSLNDKEFTESPTRWEFYDHRS